MAAIEYAKLFNVALRHNFYVGGITKDFDITPTTLTQKILKDNKLLFKNDNFGFRVMYRKSTTPPPDSFIDFANIELRFGMNMKNITAFLNFTNLDKSPTKLFKTGNILYFYNNTVTTHKLKYDILDELRPNLFNYEFPQNATGPTDAGTIEIRNEATTLIFTKTGILPDVSNKYHFLVDLSMFPAGRFEIKTITNAGATVKTKDIYVDNELASSSVCGVIKIKAVSAANTDWPPANLPTDQVREYYTEFLRRDTKWRYIVVPKLTGIPAASLSVVDAVVDPTPYNPGGTLYTFNNIVAPPAPIINGVQTTVYESTVVIPFFETPKTGLRIMNGATQVLGNITNPAKNVVSALSTDFNTTVIYVIV